MTPQQVEIDPEAIRSRVASILEERQLPGCSFAIARKGKTVLRTGVGLARIQEATPASWETAYAVGSLTKQFTAAGVMLLVEQDQVSLDDEITQFLLPRATPDERPTIRHLLSHTSGISPHLDHAMLADPSTNLTDDALLGVLLAPFEDRPGTAWRYSSTGFAIVSMLIERITGQRYPDFIRFRLFQPLGLVSTTYGPPSQGAASGHSHTAGGHVLAETPPIRATRGSAGIWSTAEDLLRWERALRTGAVISRRSYLTMTTSVSLAGGAPTDYGLAFFLNNWNGHAEVSHDGSTGGFSAQLAHYPDDDLAVAVLVNAESHESERIEKAIVRDVLHIPEPSIAPYRISNETLMTFVGEYRYQGQELPVRIRGDALTVRSPGGIVTPLTPRNGSTFSYENDPQQTIEFTVSAGHVDGLTVRRGGKVIAYAKRQY